LYEKPIIDIENGMFQVFEVKQVIHAIEDLLEDICSSNDAETTQLVVKKGKLLEDNVVELFKSFFKEDYKCYQGYFVDGNEQDVLFLWKDYAFIIEAKGYNLREPLRDPEKAFIRIKDDFKSCIGYGYKQTSRIEQKFIDKVELVIQDKDGKILDKIDTAKYEDNDFSIIVNLKSFGQIQNDLSTLLEIDDDKAFPWVVKWDDLEVFILTLIAQKKNPEIFAEFLMMREDLHGKLLCSDELQICGAFLTKKINKKMIEKNSLIAMHPDTTQVFDDQYDKVMGFKNEKYLMQKTSGQYLFY
jgi:hypothetical protein